MKNYNILGLMMVCASLSAFMPGNTPQQQEKLKDALSGKFYIGTAVNAAKNKRWFDFFRLFLKHKEVISRVTLWGVNDAQSWKNNWPVRGRTDFPLLFDRKNQPKPVVQKIIDEAK